MSLNEFNARVARNPFRVARKSNTREAVARAVGTSIQNVKRHELGLLNEPSSDMIQYCDVTLSEYYMWQKYVRDLTAEWFPFYVWDMVTPVEYELEVRETCQEFYSLSYTPGRQALSQHLVMHPRNWDLHLRKPKGVPPSGELAWVLGEVDAL